LQQRRAVAGRLFIAPNGIAVLVFLLFPLAFSLYLSFHRWNLFSPPAFVGLANYRRLVTGDRLFYVALGNTVTFTLITVTATTVIGVVVAAVLNCTVAGIGLFRSITFLPLAASTAAMTVVWRFIFTTDGGMLNTALGWFGLGPVGWLTDPHAALAALCVVSIWKGVPFATVVLLAGMQTIPGELFEAAAIDGAGSMRRFRSITLPLIRPAVSFVVVISIINSFQAFDQAYVLTGGTGGPETGTYLLSIMMFQNAFGFNDLGYSCALAWVIFAGLLILTFLQLRLSRTDHPEA
jgi:multiple sugar transport system permease protein